MSVIRLQYFFLLLLGPMLSFGQSNIMQDADQAFEKADYSKALKLYIQAGQACQKKGDQAGYTHCQLDAVSCHIRLGQYQDAQDLAEKASEYISVSAQDDTMLQAKAKQLTGESMLNLGRNDLALENLLAAEMLFPEKSLLERSACYNLLGVTYLNNGNQDLALQYHEQALDIRRKELGRSSIEAANSYNNIGLVYLDQGNYLQATIYFSRTLALFKNLLGNNHPKVAFCLINLARANNLSGNYDEAVGQLQEVQGIWDQNYEGDHPNKAFTLSTAGQIEVTNDNLEKASQLQIESLDMYIRLYGQKHPEVANTYYLLGEVFRKQNKYKEANNYYQRSIFANLYDQQFQDEDELPRLSSYYNADVLLTSMMAKAKALEAIHFGKTLRPRELKNAIALYAKCDTLISQIRQRRLNEKDKLRLGSQAKEAYENGIRLAMILADQPFHSAYKVIAFGFAERSKSSVLLEAIAETKAKDFAGIPHHLLTREDSLKNEITFLNEQIAKGAEDEAELRKSLFDTQATYRDFIAQLEVDYHEYFNLKYNSQLATVSQIQQGLNGTSALLSYFEGKETIYIFYIDQDDLEVYAKPKGEDFLKQVKGLRNAIKYDIKGTYTQAAVSLYDQLIPKIPRHIENLILLPDGVMGTVPFEAFVSSTPQEEVSYSSYPFLVKKYNVSYDYSATLMLERKSKIDNYENGFTDILLIAPIKFDGFDISLSTLPGSKAEVKAIESVFKENHWDAHPKLEASASEYFIKNESLDQYRYLHFATHGVVHESQPELSRVFLTSTETEDGSLYAGDIYNLKINAELVTLSACETGLGKITKGEGIVGLSRALLYAGAENLLVSLWQVSDASTAELMIEFYRQHLAESYLQEFNDALRKAKMKLVNSSDYSRPYFWAPFVLIGH
ncbi:MAG: CHAT domain-containing protein [Cyclobacteriaceae bacterium]|nr:CHAT domain-containing protein [Cyclobacteriaceae bacterium HetDA_MAG_MS6]